MNVVILPIVQYHSDDSSSEREGITTSVTVMKSLEQLMWLQKVYFHTAGTEEDTLSRRRY